MTQTNQKAFDVYRVADCGAVDCFRMKWPAAAVRENLKVTITHGADPLWTAAQLRLLATQIENGQSSVTGREG